MPAIADIDLEFDTADLGDFTAIEITDIDPATIDPATIDRELEQASEPASEPPAKPEPDQEPTSEQTEAIDVLSPVDSPVEPFTRIDAELPTDGTGSRMAQFFESLQKLRESVLSKRGAVADQSVECHRLKEQIATARAELKESTTELSEMERKLETMEEQWESGTWDTPPSPVPPSANVPTGSTNVAARGETKGDATSEPEDANVMPEVVGPANSIVDDPAKTARIADLGLTPGRLEKLEIAGCRTVSDLEAMLRSGDLLKLKGFGEKAIEFVSEAYRIWRISHPVPDSMLEAPELVNGEFDPIQYRYGRMSFANGVEREKNPLTPIRGFAWRSWDAGWVIACRESGVDPATTNAFTDPANDDATESINAESANSGMGDERGPGNGGVMTPEGQAIQHMVTSDPEIRGQPEMVEAYTAGCEAAMSDKPVTVNPHRKGTMLWRAWDKGWQECFKGDELEDYEEGDDKSGDEKVNGGAR